VKTSEPLTSCQKAAAHTSVNDPIGKGVYSQKNIWEF